MKHEEFIAEWGEALLAEAKFLLETDLELLVAAETRKRLAASQARAAKDALYIRHFADCVESWVRAGAMPEPEKVRTILKGLRACAAPSSAAVARPVCSFCNDTHRVEIEDQARSIMCTRCPTPCQKCRAGGNGPYCEKTPCACDCHPRAAAASVQTEPPACCVECRHVEGDVHMVVPDFPGCAYAGRCDCHRRGGTPVDATGQEDSEPPEPGKGQPPAASTSLDPVRLGGLSPEQERPKGAPSASGSRTPDPALSSPAPVAALEVALCRCGHALLEHTGPERSCAHRDTAIKGNVEADFFCGCDAFEPETPVPAPPPAPAAPLKSEGAATPLGERLDAIEEQIGDLWDAIGLLRADLARAAPEVPHGG